MTRFAALLRGINAGRKLPMAELREAVTALGWSDAQTLLASGNVVFAADGDAAAIERALETELARRGCATEAFVRDAAAIAAIVAANPFPDAAREHPHHLQVHVFRATVPPEPIARLAQLYAGPERLAAIGRELFVDYPDDIGHSKLPQAMAKAGFPKAATGRNWNTLLKLRELLSPDASLQDNPN